ncbi:MAG: hypothetical protein RR653_04565 [Clostridia bacterium]
MKPFHERLQAFGKDELLYHILNYARQLTPSKRTAFMACFGTEPQAAEPAAEILPTLSEAISALETERFAIDLSYREPEYYSYRSYPEDEEEPCYCDNAGTCAEIERILAQIKELVLDGAYAQARQFYDRMTDVRIMANDADDIGFDDEDFSLPDLHDNELLTADLKQAAALCLYAVYRDAPKEKRAMRLMNHWAWKQWGTITVDALLSAGPEPLPDFDAFLDDWIFQLKQTQGLDAQALLKESVLIRDGADALGPLCRECAASYPTLCAEWFDVLFNQHKLAQICDEAETTVSLLALAPKAKAHVARIGLYAAKQRGLDPLAQAMMEACFQAKPDTQNLLRMLALPDPSIFENACAAQSSRILRFFHGDFESLFSLLKQSYQPLAWSGDDYSVLTALFLLLPVEAQALTALMKDVLNALGPRLGYTPEYDDPPFCECYALWREHIGTVDASPYLADCEQMVLERVKGIVSNQHRSAYARAAENAMLLAQVKALVLPSCTIKSTLQAIRGQYPRHRAFQQAFEKYGF